MLHLLEHLLHGLSGYAVVAEIDESDVCEPSHDFVCSLLLLCGVGRITILVEIDDRNSKGVLCLHSS